MLYWAIHDDRFDAYEIPEQGSYGARATAAGCGARRGADATQGARRVAVCARAPGRKARAEVVVQGRRAEQRRATATRGQEQRVLAWVPGVRRACEAEHAGYVL